MKKKGKKMTKKRKVIIGVVVVVLIAAAGTFTIIKIKGSNGNAPQFTTTVQTANAELGTISSSIVGTGNLESDSASDIVIPSGLTINKVYVSAGSDVKEGDVLAIVDETSVLVAIDDLQSQIADLDDEIEDARDDTDDDEIEAGISGTVTKIYAAEDETVSECMAENRALMVITMDDDTEIAVTGTVGTIDSIKVAEGDEVDAGDTLFTLTDMPVTSAYQELLYERQELTELLSNLFVIKKTNSIVAPCDGIIETVNVTGSSSTLSSETGEAVIISSEAVNVTYLTSSEIEAEAETVSDTEAGNGTEAENGTEAGGSTEEGSSTEAGGSTEEGSNTEAGNSTEADGGVETGNTAGNTTGNTTENTTGMSGAGNSQQKGTGTSGTGSTAVASTSGSTTGSTVSGTDTTTSDSNTMTAFTIASADNMLLAVTVDELDINSLSVGQEATVTLDALEDEEFTGSVTAISYSATSSGGVAKYTAYITIPKTDEMKTGMNASATIIIENAENVITIPVNALQEQGNKSFVYTEEDADGNLSGEVEVTTGLSDGSTVEITEGLSEGDTVYYTRVGITSSSDSTMNFGGYGGMGGSGKNFDNGERPTGNMPQGSNPSGGMGQ